jgi:hypothetical protein
MKLPLLHNTRIHTPEGNFGNSRRRTIRRMPGDRNSLSLDASLAIPTRVLCFEVSRRARIPSLSAEPPVLALWLNQATPDGFVVNRRKPRRLGAASTPIPLMTWPPRRPGSTLVLRLNHETVPDFVLLFLPPCGPHLISFGHRIRRAEPTCLSTSRRPHRLRPFAPALHLHQCKSRHNLHLQYSTKIQSHTTLSITHHTKERPSTGRQTLRSSGRRLAGGEEQSEVCNK